MNAGLVDSYYVSSGEIRRVLDRTKTTWGNITIPNDTAAASNYFKYTTTTGNFLDDILKFNQDTLFWRSNSSEAPIKKRPPNEIPPTEDMLKDMLSE